MIFYKKETEIKIELVSRPAPPQANVPTPEKEKKLLGPLYAPFSKSSTLQTMDEANIKGFEPDRLEADSCKVFLNLDSSTFYLVGTLLRNFMHVKENLFGEDQKFTTMKNESEDKTGFKTTFKIHPDGSSGSTGQAAAQASKHMEFDPRLYRPIDVVLDLSVTNLLVHMLKNCSASDPPCPFLCADKLIFEMDKTYRETRLQLQFSPIILRSGEATVDKPEGDQSTQGHLMLTGLQVWSLTQFYSVDFSQTMIGVKVRFH